MNKLKNRSVLIPIIVILAVVLSMGVGGYLLYNNYNFYSTDDAQVTGTLVAIMPQISGTLTRLNVQEGDYVTAHQIIGMIEPMGFQSFADPLRAPEAGIIVNVPGVVDQQVTTATTVAQREDHGLRR